MRQYIGARYMPKFMGEYDGDQSYEALSVVDNGMGTSYVSNKPVPAGTPLNNTEYWTIYGSTNGAIIHLQEEIDEINNITIPGYAYYVTPEMFGAKGDGTTDDTQSIQDAIDFCEDNNRLLMFKDKTYCVEIQASDPTTPTNGATVPCAIVIRSCHIRLNNTIIKIKTGFTSDYYYNVILFDDASNSSITGPGTIIGDRLLRTGTGELGHVLGIIGGDNIEVSDLSLINGWGDGLYMNCDDLGYSTNIPTNIRVHDIICDNNRRNGSGIVAGENIHIYNCEFNNSNGTAPEGGLNIESSAITISKVSEIYVSNCSAMGNNGVGFNGNVRTSNAHVFFNNITTDTGIGGYIDNENCIVRYDGVTAEKGSNSFHKIGFKYGTLNSKSGSTFICTNAFIKGHKHKAAFTFTNSGSDRNIIIDNVIADMIDFNDVGTTDPQDAVILTGDTSIDNIFINMTVINGNLIELFNALSNPSTSNGHVMFDVKNCQTTYDRRSILPGHGHTGICELKRTDIKEIDAAAYLCGQYNYYELKNGANTIHPAYLRSGQTIFVTNSKTDNTTALLNTDNSEIMIMVEGRETPSHNYTIYPGAVISICYDKILNVYLIREVAGKQYNNYSFVLAGDSIQYTMQGHSVMVFISRDATVGIFGIEDSLGIVTPLITANNCTVTYNPSTRVITVTNTGTNGCAVMITNFY